MTACPVCGGEGRVYRMTPAYEAMATQASGGSFGWTGTTHEWRDCRPCGGTGLLAESRNATLDEVVRVVEGLTSEAGGECRVPDDIEDQICMTHSEILFDSACEDQPRQLLAVLDAVKGLRS